MRYCQTAIVVLIFMFNFLSTAYALDPAEIKRAEGRVKDATETLASKEKAAKEAMEAWDKSLDKVKTLQEEQDLLEENGKFVRQLPEQLDIAWGENEEAYTKWRKIQNELRDAIQELDEAKKALKEAKENPVTRGIKTQTPVAPSIVESKGSRECNCKFSVQEVKGKPYLDTDFQQDYRYLQFTYLSMKSEKGLFAEARVQAYDAYPVSNSKAEIQQKEIIQSIVSYKIEHSSESDECGTRSHKALIYGVMQPQFTVDYKTFNPDIVTDISFFMSMKTKDYTVVNLEYKDNTKYDSGSSISANLVVTSSGPGVSIGSTSSGNSLTTAPQNKYFTTAGPVRFGADLTLKSETFYFATGWKSFRVGADNDVYLPIANIPFVGASFLGKFGLNSDKDLGTPDRANAIEQLLGFSDTAEIEVRFRELDWNLQIDGYCNGKTTKKLLCIENRETTVKYKK